MSDQITLRRPDDFHLHLRDGAILEAVAGASTDFARAIVMPNLVPPLTTAAMVADYRARIEEALPEGARFEPLMTLYLCDDTSPEEIDAAANVCTAAKLYPAHATTNSASGVNDIEALTPVLERMAERGLLLLIHGEVTDHAVDIFDREAVFLERVLDPLRRRVPELKVVLEHVSSRTGIDYVMAGGENLAGTITAHHLVIDRNDLLAGGIRPHNYCLPVVKRAEDREALVAAATSDHPRVFFGSDSAPHTDPKKLGPCGAAGCFTAPVSLPILAEVFERAGVLDKLEGFVAEKGAAYYGLGANEGTVSLVRTDPYQLPPIATPDGPIAMFDPGFALTWRVA
ncbi:dihydroorotase [Acuticoccus mangrovi]|uniref:Dihydroorotase n=1 Tax=Acuticoccus mangrovi TaxID=2796142 RepID=A0A934IGY8_9HYPH|nr:dihydroorotase [Acuticoccus mangrovi]MBJ3776268.1 dihydroorotase [Acuticoccus mangrovi]